MEEGLDLLVTQEGTLNRGPAIIASQEEMMDTEMKIDMIEGTTTTMMIEEIEVIAETGETKNGIEVGSSSTMATAGQALEGDVGRL